MRERKMLAVLLAGQFMVNIDTAVANVAGPAIRDGLHTSGGELQAVVSGYTLAYAVLLVTGARLGDLLGTRRVFLAGLAGFTVASSACGAAPGTAVLVTARVVQGAAGALMVPQVLSSIQAHFAGPERARAQGMLVLTLSGGAVCGQVLGGLIVSANMFGLAWRPIFLINVPVGAVLLAAGRRLLPPSGRRAAGRPDPPGVVLLSSGVLLVVVPLLFGRETHWAPWTWVSLAASGPVLAAFAAWQRRLATRGGSPLLDPSVLVNPVVAWTLAAYAAMTATYFSMLFTLALFLQQGLGHSALYSGLAPLSWVAAFGLGGPLVARLPGRLAARLGPVACLVLAAAFAGISVTGAGGGALMALLGAGGLGLGVGFAVHLGRLTAAVPARNAPDISGLVSTTGQLSGVLGVAVLGTVYLALAGHPHHAFAMVMALSAAGAAAAAAFSYAGGRAGAARAGRDRRADERVAAAR